MDFSESNVDIVLLERVGGRGKVNLPLETPFNADSSELLLASIALMLRDILVDCECT